ncbi:MAG: hypothetical protein HQK94_19010 [Nitrospirae bacterium]|nr:hypothetical protein [Nitrospirota bacterium]
MNFYIGKRDNPKKKDNFWIVAYSKDLVNMNSLHIAWTYLKRFQCEEMHKELKSRLNLLSLNKQRYYKEAYNTEIVNKFLMVLITAFFIGLYIGGLFKHRYKENLNVIVSYEKELSLFGIGLFIISIINTPNSENFRFTPRLLKTIRLSLQRRI